jgi:hypothetical protein
MGHGRELTAGDVPQQSSEWGGRSFGRPYQSNPLLPIDMLNHIENLGRVLAARAPHQPVKNRSREIGKFSMAQHQIRQGDFVAIAHKSRNIRHRLGG